MNLQVRDFIRLPQVRIERKVIISHEYNAKKKKNERILWWMPREGMPSGTQLANLYTVLTK